MLCGQRCLTVTLARFGIDNQRLTRRMKVNLKDQVAIVTGAAQGIGKSIAETLAANQARVILTDIDFPKPNP